MGAYSLETGILKFILRVSEFRVDQDSGFKLVMA